MIDIDNFKHINDTYGHHTGDKVLNKIGLFLKECTREIDIAGRLGGEEFAILFWNISEKDSITRTEAIRLAIEKLQIHVNEIKIPVTISIGISFCTKDTSCNLHHILKKADIALYRAKNTGRNRVILYDKSMKTL
jgi:diguanylate cyclase (GGDEF)-like protein